MKKKVNIKEIIPNKENPRFISDKKFEKLVKSIKDFPEMLEKRPLVVDENMVVLGGNMRLKALQKAGFKEIIVDVAENWSEEKKKEFIIKDNVGFGEWDWDVLANIYDKDLLIDYGIDILFDDNVDLDDFFEENEKKNENKNKIILEYNQKDYEIIKNKLDSLEGSKEKIIYDLLIK
jgi:hypothetical protein